MGKKFEGLKSLSLPELKDLAGRIELELRQRVLAPVRAKVEALVQANGLTLQDLYPGIAAENPQRSMRESIGRSKKLKEPDNAPSE